MCALIRQTWFEAAVRNLSDPERLLFYESCFRYEFSGEEPTRKTCPYSSVLLMFDMVKVDLAADAEKARRIQLRNQANGSLGGRPKKDNSMLQSTENPTKPKETHENPPLLSGLTLHNTTQQNTTTAAAAGVLDGAFFEDQIWPKINTEGKFRSRHRACMAMWLSFSYPKRLAIAEQVKSDMFAATGNPYFYLEDFGEPTPHYLSGREMEEEWKSGRSVYQIQVEGKVQTVTRSDLEAYNLTAIGELKPMND